MKIFSHGIGKRLFVEVACVHCACVQTTTLRVYEFYSRYRRGLRCTECQIVKTSEQTTAIFLDNSYFVFIGNIRRSYLMDYTEEGVPWTDPYLQ